MTPPQHAAARQSSEEGFTLLEMLVSCVMLALLILAMPSAFRLAQRAVGVADRLEVGAVEKSRLDFIERRISESVAIYQHSLDGRLAIAFVGEHQSLSFIAPMVVDTAAGGLFHFKLSQVAAEDGHNELVLAWQAFRANGNYRSNPPAEEHRVVLARPEDFGIRYFGVHNLGADPEWRDNWTSSNALPSLVELTYRTPMPKSEQITRKIEIHLSNRS